MSFEPCQAMNTTGLHLVIGGKSLGKTKIMNTMVDQAGDAALLYVNMRLALSSGDVLQCLQAEGKRRWNTCYVCSFGSGGLQEGRGCGGWSGAGFFYPVKY